MSLKFACDKDTLVGYLYNEVDDRERQQVEDHLARCTECAAEVAALSGVRTSLSGWAPPDAELGFAIVQRGAVQRGAVRQASPPGNVLRPAQWGSTVPAWAQAIAAIFVLAVSAAVANVQVKSSADGFVVSTGWITPAAARTPAAPVVAADANSGQWQPALIALERQLREEIRAARETGTVRVASRSQVDEATLARVRVLLEASETKHNRELAMRMTQLAGDINVQRRADLLRVEQAIGHTGVEMARQGERLNYVIRASAVPRQ